ncbi:MAG: hypothetical protein KMY53_02195 [Desulfarculus sp.]|nr:hypothetical protein [Pseudomonadota bacterium]MBU4596927.1 hypothetical protein [Pseudomonadota bacterium]MBV1717340.1 hypothetical protein [Desulfarculus sp.]MBV1736950.1 hypothetical protein [Desulfarculus sp.]MBV1750794.1 hypothetical protein [Desulfarculus sp.]
MAVLDHMEGKGFHLAQAEALAYATMQVLLQRRGGPLGFAKSEVPDEVAELVGAMNDVFGDGVEVEWRPEHAAGYTDQPEQQADLVRCQNCQHFDRGQGDPNNALGHCNGQPWDGHQGQWPKAEHRCLSYKCSKLSS